LKVHINDKEMILKGTISQLVADNLGAHSILGFVECFSGRSSYISRYCLCTGEDIQHLVCVVVQCVLIFYFKDLNFMYAEY